MLRCKNDINYDKLNTSILEGGGLYDLEAVIKELKIYDDNFETHAMSDRQLFLQGQKDMLEKIIKYLERVL